MPNQPGELRKVSQSAVPHRTAGRAGDHVRPPVPTWANRPSSYRPTATSTWALRETSTSPGLTLAEAEERIAVQLNDAAREQGSSAEQALPGLGAAGDRPEQVLLRAGHRRHAGPSSRPMRNDTVLDAILQAGLKIQQPAREGLSGSSASARWRRTRFTRSTGSASRIGATR